MGAHCIGAMTDTETHLWPAYVSIQQDTNTGAVTIHVRATSADRGHLTVEGPQASMTMTQHAWAKLKQEILKNDVYTSAI